MHNPRTEALVKAAGRIIDPKMYELASELENELGQHTDAANPNGSVYARLKWWKDNADDDAEEIDRLKADNDALRNQLALERKHLTASGRYTNT